MAEVYGTRRAANVGGGYGFYRAASDLGGVTPTCQTRNFRVCATGQNDSRRGGRGDGRPLQMGNRTILDCVAAGVGGGIERDSASFRRGGRRSAHTYAGLSSL